MQQVHAAYPTLSLSAAQFACPQLLTQKGWQVSLASESVVLAELDMLGLAPGFAKARTERELQRTWRARTDRSDAQIQLRRRQVDTESASLG